MNGYDFDNTIYNGDSTIQFYFFLIKRHPLYFYKFISFLVSYILYLMKIKDKIYAKEKMFSIFSKIENIENEVNIFWKNRNLTNWYLENKRSDDVIISASPYFLLKPICDAMEIKNLIATDVNKVNGKFNSPNCYGEEKVTFFKEKYGDLKLKRFYTDSMSDICMLKVSCEVCIVKNGKKGAKFKVIKNNSNVIE